MLQTRVENLPSQETDVKEMIDIIKEMDPVLKMEVKGILKGKCKAWREIMDGKKG